MKRIIADVHTHTIASGHAFGTIREMALAASERKLDILGITEHAPGIPGTVNPIYYTCLNLVPRVLSGVYLIHGCEINIMNDGSLSLDDCYIEKLDYAIAGIHLHCYQDAGREKNTNNVISCMKHPKVRFISHPDDDNTPLDYHLLVQAAHDTNTALEVNNSSLFRKEHRLNCYENYITMLNLCQKMDTPVIISSDAHDPSWVGRFDLSEALLDSLSFPEHLILNLDSKKLLDFLLC